ncbi:MAG TPA: STAS domain-containing protein [Rectinemataceae bacterium]|nr:STAS domain-containing protein [Rectinemataceae bacterium]
MNENPSYRPGRDIVVATVDAMKAELKELIASSTGNLTVDMSGVEMIDSKGLGLLIAASNTLGASARKLRIVGAVPDIVELFRVMRLDRHFEID